MWGAPTTTTPPPPPTTTTPPTTPTSTLLPPSLATPTNRSCCPKPETQNASPNKARNRLGRGPPSVPGKRPALRSLGLTGVLSCGCVDVPGSKAQGTKMPLNQNN